MSTLPSNSLGRWAVYLGLLLGLGLLAHAVQTFVAVDDPPPLPYRFAIIFCGLLEIALSVASYYRRRAAWSFLVSLNGTLFVVGLFGGPKIRDTFDIDLAFALVPCFLFGVVCTLAAVAHEDFDGN